MRFDWPNSAPKPLFWRLRFELRLAAKAAITWAIGPALGALGPALADRAHVANPGGPDLETALGQLEHFHFGPVA